MKRLIDLLYIVLLLSFILGSRNGGRVSSGPDPLFEKPDPITMETLNGKAIQGVEAYEVTDYAPGHYREKIPNTKPHADHNPHKAVIIKWEDYPGQMFVFNHEASYTPWMKLPGGLGLCNQFFEGNDGYAELFNENGRKERNSFVDIIRSGPDESWIRWNYFDVNVMSDSLPALRGTEDYFGGSYGFPEVYTTAYVGNVLDNKSATDGGPRKWSLYRWHIMDPIYFKQDLRMTIQALGRYNGKPGGYRPLADDIASVAYWYQVEPHSAFPKLPEVKERWPR
jgi:hypothetical protein